MMKAEAFLKLGKSLPYFTTQHPRDSHLQVVECFFTQGVSVLEFIIPTS
jgi:hypothetical protein